MHAHVRAHRKLAIALALWATAAWAELDTFGLGTGRSGPLTVSGSASLVVNRASALSQSRKPGDTALPVKDASSFHGGDLVLVVQSTGLLPAPASGAAGPFDLSATSVGRWELARVATVDDKGLALTAPLTGAYPAPGAQVVLVPEYTNVILVSGATVAAAPWNGEAGGVVAFLASGNVINHGRISADATGFAGGLFEDDTVSTHNGCMEMDTQPGLGGRKGEGVSPSLGTRYGAGNVANGGGGGDCHDAGGGGGGNGGPGGQGGRSYDGARDVGGRGGAALGYALPGRLLFGGGGGAGYGHSGQGSGGGRGGGAIFVRASAMSGQGRVSANGETAADTGGEGAGGGGAGGSISLRLASTLDCASVEAKGGGGGTTGRPDTGPGGGGGGGRILLQADSMQCPASSDTGVAGDNGSTGAYGSTYGAQPASVSSGDVSRLSGGYAVPRSPVLTAPSQGLVTEESRPLFTGIAEPGVDVRLLLDGVELARVQASPLGDFTFQPAVALGPGPHRAQAQAASPQLDYSAPGDPVDFTITGADAGTPDAGTREKVQLAVGCGCGATSGPLALSLALLGALALRRVRRSPPPAAP